MNKRMAVLMAFMAAGSISGQAFAGRSDRVDGFTPLGFFLVPNGGVAEIVGATPDARTLVYASSTNHRVGFVDISDPESPSLIKEIGVEGEPTSVAVSPDGGFALVGLQTTAFVVGQPPVQTPGKLLVLRVAEASVLGSVPLGTGPDSVALTEIGGETVAVIAIENEPILVDPDGNFVAGDLPGQPNDVSAKGFVQVVTIDWAHLEQSNVADVRFDDEAFLTSLGLSFPNDPQPEFVSIRAGLAAVTLQENNGVAIIDLSDPRKPQLVRIFNAGKASDRPADVKRDGVISLTDVYPASVIAQPHAGERSPDSIVWNARGTALFTADEGELAFTGSRGFTAFRPDGTVLWEDRGELEAIAVTRGQYPEARSAAKGVELEGLAIGTYGKREFAFVASERGSFLGVYDVTDPEDPEFVQFLATGLRPEGVLALPQRNLVVTAEESDGSSGTFSIYAGIPGTTLPPLNRPTLLSSGVEEPFGALSGLAADPSRQDVLYSVPDGALVSTIYRIKISGHLAHVENLVPVTRLSLQAKYDLEGIANDTSREHPSFERGGFWLAAEGNAKFGATDYLPNLLVQVDARGRVLQEIRLPEDLDPSTKPEVTDGRVQNAGFQGVAVSSNGRYLLAPIGRELSKEPAVGGILHTRIARFDLKNDAWEFFLYPLDVTATPGDSIVLSEIVNLGNDRYAVIERDRQKASLAKVKVIYAFTLEGVAPTTGPVTADLDLTGRVIQKNVLLDVLEDFIPFEKVEGLALTGSGRLWACLDNDGGQYAPLLVKLGRLSRSLKVFPDEEDDGDEDQDDNKHKKDHHQHKKGKEHKR
jgi:hypothetical protein